MVFLWDQLIFDWTDGLMDGWMDGWMSVKAVTHFTHLCQRLTTDSAQTMSEKLRSPVQRCVFSGDNSEAAEVLTATSTNNNANPAEWEEMDACSCTE